MTRLYLFLLILWAVPASLYAQTEEETEKPSASLHAQARLDVRPGFLLQELFYYYPDGDSGNQVGFRLPTARLRLDSSWEQKYRFFIQVDFVRPITVLDAFATVPVNEYVDIQAGLFKSPFSREFLLFPEDVPFIERSRVVQALVPNRQIGVSLLVHLLENRLTLEGGVFNGNNASLEGNDNGHFMVAGRMNWMAKLPDGSVQVGVNGAYSEDANLRLPVVGISNGERIIMGADAEIMFERWFARGEFIAASFGNGSSIDTAYGYVGTLGVKVFDTHHLHASYDVYDPGADVGEHAVFSYKLYLGEAVTLLANYRLPLDEPRRSEFVLRLQFAVR